MKIGLSIWALGALLSISDDPIWALVGKIVWALGFALGMAGLIQQTRRQPHTNPGFLMFLVALLVASSGFMLASAWFSWQVILIDRGLKP